MRTTPDPTDVLAAYLEQCRTEYLSVVVGDDYGGQRCVAEAARCFARARACLRVGVVDTVGVLIGIETGGQDSEFWELLDLREHEVDCEDALDLVAAWLARDGWTDSDGAEEAAEIVRRHLGQDVTASVDAAPRAALDAMAPDLAAVLHEVLCPSCRACIRDALRVLVVDQTYGIGVSDTGSDDDAHVLLVAWHEPFGSLEIDEALVLCTEWLDRECWRPDDGAAEAACVVWAAAKLVDEEAVRAWVAARRPT